MSVIKCSKYDQGVFCARGKAEGYKTHCVHNCYSILQQKSHFDDPKRSLVNITYKITHSYPAKYS